MIKMIIIDDEQSTLDYFAINVLESFSDQLQIIGSFTDPDEGVRGVKLLKPDLVVIDMHFPNSSGLIVAKQISKCPVVPIFLTGKAEKIIEALELSDLYYMLKPLRRIDIQNMIIRYKSQMKFEEEISIDHEEIQDQKIINAENHLKEPKERKETSIFLNSVNKIDVVDMNNIAYIEADGQHTYVVLTEGAPILTSKPMAYFQQLLEDNELFFRCHRSYIVNVKKIKNIEKIKYTYELVMENDLRLVVSFLKKRELNERIKLLK